MSEVPLYVTARVEEPDAYMSCSKIRFYRGYLAHEKQHPPRTLT